MAFTPNSIFFSHPWGEQPSVLITRKGDLHDLTLTLIIVPDCDWQLQLNIFSPITVANLPELKCLSRDFQTSIALKCGK